MFTLRTILTRTALSFVLITPTLALAAEAQATATAQPAQASATTSLNGLALQGTILETMNNDGFTYLLLDTEQGKIWIAIPETQVTLGQSLTCEGGITMHNVTPKALDRTFEAILFSPGLVNKGAPATKQVQPVQPTAKNTSFDAALQTESERPTGIPGLVGEAGSLESPGSTGAVVPSAEVNVNKATGANSFSVGECFEQAAKLNGTFVRVRGKVMKISRMIMGKNWLHIQDGTGDPLKNQHDLVVTTIEDATVGAIVTIEGKLVVDRDFGAGYRYDVIIEDAKVEK